MEDMVIAVVIVVKVAETTLHVGVAHFLFHDAKLHVNNLTP